MDYINPIQATRTMLTVGATKAELPIKDLLIRGFLSGALLAFATALAITATVQTNLPLVGAVIFPVGFAMIILLGLELVTGSFALVPLAAVNGQTAWSRVASNLTWVFLANLAGSMVFGILLYLAITNCGTVPPSGIALKIAAIAEAKTAGYAAHGAAGWMTAFVKGVLCNWMVCLGVVVPMTSSSTLGKIAGAWMPIFTFFALGFEHSVVNMFLIPTGMLFGAKVGLGGWWFWNQIPVTLGNFAGGFLFTGLFLYWTYGPARQTAAAVADIPEAEPSRA